MATRATTKKISSPAEIKARMGGTFELPSGLVVRLKNPGGLKAFLGHGKIPNGLLQVIKETQESGKDASQLSEEEKAAKVEKVLENDDSLADLMEMMDLVAVQTIVEPKVYPTPEEGEEKDESLLYPSDFSDRDKQWIFSWVQGGVEELKPFRKK